MSRKNFFALCAILFVATMLGTRLWADARRDALPVLSTVEQAPDGRVFAVFGQTLHIESRDGDSLAVIPLARFGVDAFHGDLAVLPDGSIILAQGRLPEVTVAENLLVTARQANESNTPSEPLIRCTLDEARCAPLVAGNPAYRAGRTFMLAVVGDGRRIVVADTARHRLLLVGLDGQVLDSIGSGFHFPNQVQAISPTEVVVADTRNNRLASVAVGADSFGAVTTVSDIDCWPGSAVRRYPSGFAELANGSRWALTATTDLMNHGLYRLTGECATTIDLPANADPMFLGVAGDTLLVPDAEHYRVLRFDAYGTQLPDFGSAALRAELDRVGAQKATFTALFDYSLWLLVLAAIAMIVIGRRIDAEEKARAARGAVITEPATTGGLPPQSSQQPRPASAVAASMDPAAQLRALRQEQVFRRRLLPIDTRVAAWLYATCAVGACAVIGWFAWYEASSSRWEGVLPMLRASNGVLVAAAVLVAAIVATWLSLRHERLVVGRDGIRYIAPPYAPGRSWFLAWTRVASVELRHIKTGMRPEQWFFVITDDRDAARITPALFWRAEGRRDGGLAFSEISIVDAGTYRAAIQRTALYQLLAPGKVVTGIGGSPAVSAAPPAPDFTAIELVMVPPRYPKAVRRQFGFGIALVAVYSVVRIWGAFDVGWPPDWAYVAGQLVAAFEAAPLKFAILPVMLLSVPLVYQNMKRIRLSIASDAITLQSFLPRPLKFSPTDWTVRREDIQSVELVAKMPQVHATYQVRLRTNGKPRTINVFQWYRLDRDIETQEAVPTRVTFRAATLLAKARTSPLVTALEDAGFTVENLTGTSDPAVERA